MFKIRKAGERGHANYGWLDTYHTFSFGDYVDYEYMGFLSLNVLNEDRVAPGQGFPMHTHKDMEIITYVLSGEIGHRDSIGNTSSVKRGQVQLMSAGTGVTHSEYNSSRNLTLHFLQTWILPREKDLEPSYQQKSFPIEEKGGELILIASSDGRDNSLKIHQEDEVYASILSKGEKITHELGNYHHAWLQLARGELKFNGELLKAGDGVQISEESSLEIFAIQESEFLLFDLV